MSRDFAKEWSTQEERIVKNLFNLLGDDGLSKMLGRTHAAVMVKRRKMGVFKKRKTKLTIAEIKEIEKLLMDGVSADDLLIVYPRIKRPTIYAIRDKMFKRISKEKPQYVLPIKSFGSLGQTAAYWKDEKQILESFDPKYEAHELKGWEKDELTKEIKPKFKLQVL